jgi:mannose-6-phosphate isomerase-like protein (cupin superfamily)
MLRIRRAGEGTRPYVIRGAKARSLRERADILNLRRSRTMVIYKLMPDKINLAQKFSQIHEYWKPYIAGELNGQLIKLDKLKGEFVWHHHENEDEMFLVVKGRFRIEFRDSSAENQNNAGEGARATRAVWLEEGEFIVVPRGVEHKPVADEECWIVLFEPASTLNTGNVENELTLRDLEKV